MWDRLVWAACCVVLRAVHDSGPFKHLLASVGDAACEGDRGAGGRAGQEARPVEHYASEVISKTINVLDIPHQKWGISLDIEKLQAMRLTYFVA